MPQTDVYFEEEIHLDMVRKTIYKQIEELSGNIDDDKESILEQKRYLWKNIYEMDPAEISSLRMVIDQDFEMYENKEKEKHLLLKLYDNTYFAKLDFTFDGEEEPESIYIGLGNFSEKKSMRQMIYDWRAPISSMFYDFDSGPAFYEAPMGRLYGTLMSKYQFRIRNGIMEYVVKSDIKVDDEILQKQLSSDGSTKMKNIVATIQREQNRIIRDTETEILIVQGVAGSGKTSVALHRVAFLLYQDRGTIQAKNVLVISPNKIFSDYISNVLPELGEENICELTIEDISNHELKGVKTESKSAQTEFIISSEQSNIRFKRIQFKSGMVFLNELNAFVVKAASIYMQFSDFSILDYTFTKELQEELYFGIFSHLPASVRIERMSDRLCMLYENEKSVILNPAVRKNITQIFETSIVKKNLLEVYQVFLNDLAEKYDIECGDTVNIHHVNYEDVFPLVYLNYSLNGKATSYFPNVKHVLIDEMQDYSMTQISLLRKMFRCKMTFLGDINQVLDRNKANLAANSQELFGDKVSIINLLKSYRSTYEISEFCRNISGYYEHDSFERHGNSPRVEDCLDFSDMMERIQSDIATLDFEKVTTAAIICKTATEARIVFNALTKENKEKYYLMNDETSKFQEGILVTNSYLVKGLEFDAVFVPQVTDDNYNTNVSRQVLYVSCTRALHALTLYYYGKRSRYIMNNN